MIYWRSPAYVTTEKPVVTEIFSYEILIRQEVEKKTVTVYLYNKVLSNSY